MRRTLCYPGLYLAAGLSLVFFGLFKFFPFAALPRRAAMVRAAEIMAAAERTLLECRERKGLSPDVATDPNRTGLVGVETSPISTTLGNLEAKRTTTNPNFAGLVVRLLNEARVKEGEAIAVGASSSFPGLLLAVLSAAKAMDVDALLICSLGASQWGANDPRFSWLDMYACIAGGMDAGGRIIALSVGGEGDTGRDMSEEGRHFLLDEARKSGLPLIEEPDLPRNVERRFRFYEECARGERIAAFVNVGGSWANIGTDASVLGLKPGSAKVRDIPPPERRGMIQEMARRGVPVIHLLNVKGLAARYGLPWDPSPLPGAGEGDLYRRSPGSNPLVMTLIGAYFVLAGLALALFRRGGGGRG
jgi:poly-gamma-glutamate system protein